jgi:hypothetical protein
VPRLPSINTAATHSIAVRSANAGTLEMTGSRATFRVLDTTWNASATSTLDRVRLKIHVS